MAKINVMTHFDSVQGKYSRTDKVYTRVRKFDDVTIGVRLKHPVTNDPPSAAQQTVQDKFTAVAAKVKAVLADPDQKASYKAKFKNQRKYVTLNSYIFHDIYKNETTNP